MTAGPEVDEWGVQASWTDADGATHELDAETVDGLRRAIGDPPADLEARAPVVTRPGRSLGLGRVRVWCEDGSEHELDDRLPDDFPLGYHQMASPDGPRRRLIVSPGRCWLPDEQHWGWTVQLYGARSSASWGMGDLGDLRALREWTEQSGGGFLLVNPLHAVAPTLPQEPSPYLPATRRFRNPIYLRVEEVPGYSAQDTSSEEVRRANTSELIDRDAVWRLKERALVAAYRRSRDSDGVEASPEALDFATWCVAAQEHGPNWHDWPAGLRDPHSPGAAAFREAHRDQVDFHAWLQDQVEAQLDAASGDLLVIQDLPVGISGGGFDAWCWQDLLASDMTVGAPPDKLNSLGQDWGSPPFIPWRLREAGYEPFIESVRSTIAGAGGLRIDHVMGLFRLWWVPTGAGPAQGGYVHYPSADLLDIVALESHRAQAVVVGEDLGTVEESVSVALAEAGILSYKVLWFEDAPATDWPREALAAVTTHDLPTVAGLWTGSDTQAQLAATDMSSDDVERSRRELLARIDPGAGSAQEAVVSTYDQLGQAPCLLVSLALEDAVLEERRPNIPGTTVRSNWSVPLPVPVDSLPGHAGARHLVEAVSPRRRVK